MASAANTQVEKVSFGYSWLCIYCVRCVETKFWVKCARSEIKLTSGPVVLVLVLSEVASPVWCREATKFIFAIKPTYCCYLRVVFMYFFMGVCGKNFCPLASIKCTTTSMTKERPLVRYAFLINLQNSPYMFYTDRACSTIPSFRGGDYKGVWSTHPQPWRFCVCMRVTKSEQPANVQVVPTKESRSTCSVWQGSELKLFWGRRRGSLMLCEVDIFDLIIMVVTLPGMQ